MRQHGFRVALWLTLTGNVACSRTVVADGAMHTVDAFSPDANVDASSPDANVDAAIDVAPTDASTDVTATPDVFDPPGSTSVTYQINLAHTGNQPDVQLALPLNRRWIRPIGSHPSYPVVARGRVFMTVDVDNSPSIFGLDAATGATVWGPIAFGAPSSPVALAWDSGRIFAVADNGDVAALDETSGTVSWRIHLGDEYAFVSAPIARDGLVFVAGPSGGLYSLRESTGEVLWSSTIGSTGGSGPPAIEGNRVFVGYACDLAFAYDVATGSEIWRHMEGCSGGGGSMPVLYEGSVYIRDPTEGDLVLDEMSGVRTGTFQSIFPPAFASGTGYFANRGDLHATTVGATSALWTAMADSDMTTAPIIVGEHVVIGSSSGTLYVFSAADGTMLTTETLPSIAVPSAIEGGTITGLAAADGMLFVPTQTGLAAFGAPTR